MTDQGRPACLVAALDYLARGWSALALCPPDHIGVGKTHGKHCDSPGKAPWGPWDRFQDELPAEDDLRAKWRDNLHLNVGVALGPVSGLVGLDVDGPEGETLLAEMAGDDLPETLEFTSGRGRRLLYAIPEGARLRPTHLPGGDRHGAVSLLAYGAQTVMPPSRHRNGSVYAWKPGHGPGEIDPAPAPGWLLAALARREGPTAAGVTVLSDDNIIPESRRDNTLTSMAGTMRRRGFTFEAIDAAIGIENGRCDPPLDPEQVHKIARSVARYDPDTFAGVDVRWPATKTIDGADASTLPRYWTHDQLLDECFPALQWVVEGLVPAGGLCILGGKKKLGKSWMCLQIAQAVAVGARTLTRDTQQGEVIYLCLEDGGRRLQDRLRKQQSPRGLPVTWFTSFRKLDDGGLDALEKLLEDRKPRLLVLDTLAASKSGKTDENASGPMADLGNALRQIAQESGTAVLATHHHGKVSYGDPGDDLRGSSAIAAAADVNLGLYRTDDGFRLRGEGRDIEECALSIRFDAHGSWSWLALGDARVISRDEADANVLGALAALKEADAETVAEFVQRARNTVGERLNKLVGQGKVLAREERSGGRGRPHILYRLPPVETPPDADLFD